MPITQTDINSLISKINDSTRSYFICNFIFDYVSIPRTLVIRNKYDQIVFKGDYDSAYMFLIGVIEGIAFGIAYSNWLLREVSNLAQNRQNLCNKERVKTKKP